MGLLERMHMYLAVHGRNYSRRGRICQVFNPDTTINGHKKRWPPGHPLTLNKRHLINQILINLVHLV